MLKIAKENLRFRDSAWCKEGFTVSQGFFVLFCYFCLHNLIFMNGTLFILLNWIFYLFTFQMLSPFPVSPLQTPYPIPPYPASMRVLPHPSTHSHPHRPSISLHWGIKPSQDQGPPLPLMPDKAPSAPSVLPLTPPLGSLRLV